ncbi:MAG: aminotransferase class I/II-fold pyridoxal phosphate-dependent enzyme [Phycisphaerales bacterium]
MSPVAAALAPFGTTIFTTMSRLALEHGAVNLSQGFPDFEGPAFVKEAAIAAIRSQSNQYAPMPGVPVLRQAIARRFTRDTGLPADPDTHVTVTAGCTEAIAATILGICNPGDEVVLFEPFYDSYRACVAMAGCVPRFVALRPDAQGRFVFDPDELAATFCPRTRAVIINTPHNPTGKVFSREELASIAALCVKHNCIAVADEVYERLIFDTARTPHVSIATLSGMADRTVVLSSLGKTFSLTGWKIGWAVAAPPLSAAVRAAHQFLTFAVNTPMQHAAAVALEREQEYVPTLVALLAANRQALCAALRELGYGVHEPYGTYFILANHSKFGFASDLAFCTHLIEKVGIAAIPPSVFYEHAELGTSLVRFAFCKRPDTIVAAIARLRAGGR